MLSVSINFWCVLNVVMYKPSIVSYHLKELNQHWSGIDIIASGTVRKKDRWVDCPHKTLKAKSQASFGSSSEIYLLIKMKTVYALREIIFVSLRQLIQYSYQFSQLY